MKVGDKVLYNGKPGRVVCVSGTDHECVVVYDAGGDSSHFDERGARTPWISQSQVYAADADTTKEVQT